MRFFARVTKRAGLVVMGSRTKRMIPKPLADRAVVILSRAGGPLPPIPQAETYTNASPTEILTVATSWGYKQAIVAGGTEVNTLFLQAGLVDEVWLSRVPVFLRMGAPVAAEPWEDDFPVRSFVSQADSVWLVKYRKV